MTATTDLDFSDPEFLLDPYPALAELRAQGPLLWHENSEKWLATTHDAVGRTLRNRSFGRIWSDWEPAEEMEPFNALHRNQMMENEPPVHTRLRRLVAAAFGRGHVERMRPRVESLAAGLLDEVATIGADGGPVDILSHYAEPLPVLVIADLLGVPGEDHLMLRDWSQDIVHMYEQGVSADVKNSAVRASIAFSDYVRGVVEDRKSNPGDDLLTDLINARDTVADGGQSRLSDDELVASVVLLLNAGHEASVNAFGNGIHALLSRPDQLARISDAEVPIDIALEELFRFDSPAQLFERTATNDVEMFGETIGKGQKIATMLGSANRDEAVFAEANDFDVSRDPNPHLGFGLGLHFCLGAPLARMELGITLDSLLKRFPQIHLAGNAPRRPTFVLRGFQGIDVSLEK